MPNNSFALKVTLGYGCEQDTEDELNKIDSKPSAAVGIISSFFAGNNNQKCFVASASHVEFSIDSSSAQSSSSTSLAVIFVPPAMIETRLEMYSSERTVAAGSCFWISDPAELTLDLLPNIHSILQDSKIKGIIRTSIAAEENAPAEMVVVEIKDMPNVLQTTNGSSLAEFPGKVLKIMPISKVSFTQQNEKVSAALRKPQELFIPACPVCIHRIDPVRLGLPSPTNEQLCSKFCASPNFNWGGSEYTQACEKQRFLEKWPDTRCRACHVIEHYWSSGNLQDESEETDLFCGGCAMHKTLWACLTCGFVGCGRYSNKHGVEHFTETNHPFALELATLRIWDYVHGEYGGYAHRVDLLECPSSPILSHPWIARRSLSAYQQLQHHATSSPRFAIDSEKAPKKATVIGEEYEALLQSALEDQAQYYEGEITRSRAELTAEFVDKTSLSEEEQREMEKLRNEIETWRKQIEDISRDYLDAQAQEAQHRATSQRLLREQQEVKELLKEIEKEGQQEAQRGKMQVEDLEQQVSDLTANLRMRQQFSENEELSKAQIFATSGETSRNTNNKRGKKKGKFFRR